MALSLALVSCLSSIIKFSIIHRHIRKWKSSWKLRRKWEFTLVIITFLEFGLYVNIYIGNMNTEKQVDFLYEEYLSKTYLELTNIQKSAKWFNCHEFIIDRHLKQIKFYNTQKVKFRISMLRIRFRKLMFFIICLIFLNWAMENLCSEK